MNLHLCQKDYVQMIVEENPMICTCHHVHLNKILHHLPEMAETVCFEALQKETGASTGCGNCLMKLENMVECYRRIPDAFVSKKTY